MTTPQLRLTHVAIRGEGVPNDTDTFGNVEYKREAGGPTAIYFTFEKPNYRDDVSYPARDDDGMKITVMPDPTSTRLVAEFCGSLVGQMVASAGAQPTVAGAVGQIAPLLRYFQEHFSVA